MFAVWLRHGPNSAYYASGGILSADYKIGETGRVDLYMLSRTQETETGGLFRVQGQPGLHSETMPHYKTRLLRLSRARPEKG